jgi:hypothetical protein
LAPSFSGVGMSEKGNIRPTWRVAPIGSPIPARQGLESGGATGGAGSATAAAAS